jgi:hypothetical protein
MFSIRFSTRLDLSHHGPPHPFRDAGVVADVLAGIHNATVKCLFVVNKSCIHKGFKFPQVKIRGHAVAQLVEALCYKPEGLRFESR